MFVDAYTSNTYGINKNKHVKHITNNTTLSSKYTIYITPYHYIYTHFYKYYESITTINLFYTQIIKP